MSRDCPWCGEPMPATDAELCSEKCAAEVREAAFWADEAKESALREHRRQLDEAGRAQRQDRQEEP